MLFDCSRTSVIFFCVWSFNLAWVSGKNNKLKMLPEDKGELTPVHTLWWVCLLYITIDIPEIYRICLLKWQEEQETDPCTLCPATENHTKITSTHPPTHPPHHLKFHLHFQTRESIPLLHKMFLSDPLSSDPPICAWVSQLVSSLFVFWIKCYIHALSLWCELQALCIQFSIISSSVNYLVKNKYKLLVTKMGKICTHIHTQIRTHIQPSQVHRFGLFVHPFSYICNNGHVNYRLQFTSHLVIYRHLHNTI